MKKYFFCFVLIFFTQNIFSAETSVSEGSSAEFYKALLSTDYDRAKEILHTENVNLNAQFEDQKDTALHLLIRQHHIETAEYIISWGADINIRMKDGRTPLHEAVNFLSGEVISRFIDLGADVHAVDNQGLTPLHDAAFRGNVSAIKALKEKGANIYAQDKDGDTPLHMVGLNGGQFSPDSVDINLVIAPFIENSNSYLKNNGIYIKNNRGRTPLHKAARYSNYPAAEAFLNLSGDRIAYAIENDNQGVSALDIAKTIKDERMARLLRYKKKGKKNLFQRCFTLFSRTH